MSEVTSSDSVENQENTDQVPTNLSLVDIANVVQIISIATQRGAWKVNELSSVGTVYDRLVAFLESAGVAIEQNDKEENQPTE